MAFDYNIASSKYFIDRLADHHVEAVTNEKTNKNGAIAVTIEFKTDADGKITYNEPKVLHKYNLSVGDTGYDASKKDNLYEEYTCDTLYGTWANPAVGGSATINGKEHICKSILDPSAIYEVFKLKNFGEFILHKELDGGPDTDAVAIDNASDEKDDEKVMTARAIEKSLAWENVNGKTGSIVSYIKNGETGDPDQPTVTGDYSLAFGHDEASDAAASADGDYAVAINGKTIGEGSVSINGKALGEHSVAINGETSEDDGSYSTVINGIAKYINGTAVGFWYNEDEDKYIPATAEGNSVAINGITGSWGSVAISGIQYSDEDHESSGIVIGGRSNGEENVSVGYFTNVGDADTRINQGVAVGSGASVNYNGGIAIGAASVVEGDDSGPSGTNERSIAIGTGLTAKNASIVIGGNEDTTTQNGSIVVGVGAQSTGDGSIIVGRGTAESYYENDDPNKHVRGIQIGSGSVYGGIGIGGEAVGAQYRSIAIGYETASTGKKSVGIGNKIKPATDHAVIVGSNNHRVTAESVTTTATAANREMFVVANGDNSWTNDDAATPRPSAEDAENSNAFAIMQNGDVFVYGLGSFDGTNVNYWNKSSVVDIVRTTDPDNPVYEREVRPLQDIILTMQKKIEYLEGVIEHITEVINN